MTCGWKDFYKLRKYNKMEATCATVGSKRSSPQQKVDNFNFLKVLICHERAITRKLRGTEQLKLEAIAYLEARLTTPESALTAPNYRVTNFKF